MLCVNGATHVGTHTYYGVPVEAKGSALLLILTSALFERGTCFLPLRSSDWELLVLRCSLPCSASHWLGTSHRLVAQQALRICLSLPPQCLQAWTTRLSAAHPHPPVGSGDGVQVHKPFINWAQMNLNYFKLRTMNKRLDEQDFIKISR